MSKHRDTIQNVDGRRQTVARLLASKFGLASAGLERLDRAERYSSELANVRRLDRL